MCSQNCLLAKVWNRTGGRYGSMLSSGINSVHQEVEKLLCEDCYHELGCSRQVDESGRCSYFIKNSKVEIDDDVKVNPMDTITYDYDDLKKLIKQTSTDIDNPPDP